MDTRRMGFWTAVVLAMTLGCEPSPVENRSTSPWGTFEGEIVAQWNPDGRNMTLREDFAFIDSRKQRWVAPAGSVVNGASIPAAFWSVIGGPFEGKYRNASVVHDVGCESMTASWQDVHRMFYDACRCGGVDEVNAKLMYYAVYHFGPRWERVTDTVMPAVPDAAEPLAANEAGVRSAVAGNSLRNSATPAAASASTISRMARFDPPPPTPEEVAQLTQMIMEENPSATEIERLDRRQMRQRNRATASEPPSLPVDPPQEVTPSRLDSIDSSVLSDSPFNPLRSPRLSSSLRDPASTASPVSPAQLALASHPAEIGNGSHQAFVRPIPLLSNQQPVSAQEESLAIAEARRYIEQQCGEQRPADFAVDFARGALRVVVTYKHQVTPESWQATGTYSTLYISQTGQLLEAFNGIR